MKVQTRSVDETRELGARLAEALLRPGDLVVLAGSLGSGKTAFAQGVARGLGVTGPVVSPTFTIVREYQGRMPLTHVDIYRLERVQELHDLGFDEMLDDRVTLVEWGDAAGPVLPADRLEVRLEMTGDEEEREIRISAHGESWQGRSRRLGELLAPLPGEPTR
ncbi:MAG: tRNA (adenosine(37)-N6)-threonylcarbamoyltransferase complex ATPase subunit type 1 TsaE [Acidimicrobiia bacterium]